MKNYLLSIGLSNSSIKEYLRQTYNFINWMEDQQLEETQVSHNDIMAYIRYIQERGVSQETVYLNLQGVRHYFSWLQHRQLRETNPVEHIKVQGIKDRVLYPCLSKTELEHIYTSYETLITPILESHNRREFSQLIKQRNKTILGLMVWQGLRTAEVEKLTQQAVKLREGKIYIPSYRKGSERVLHLKPFQIIELLEYSQKIRPQLEAMLPIKRQQQEKELFYLTPPPQGRQGAAERGVNKSLWVTLKVHVKQNNPRFINFNQVRTSVITHWLKHYNLRQVQYMAGHRSVSSTERYLVNDIETLTEEIIKYHPLNNII